MTEIWNLWQRPQGVIIIKCPVCKQTTTWEENPFRPFCSERCKLLDLGAWASGEYKIAGKKEEEEDEKGEQDNN